MKKSLLTIALCATALASATAQTKIEGSYVKFDPIEMNGKEIPVMGSFHKVSPNGQWAVGSDDSGQVGWSFIYSVADDKLTTLEDPSVTELYYIVADVANDGTMVGAYTNDAGEIVPGIRKSADSEWEPLPVPEDHMPAHSSASGFSSARAINGDGTIIAGHLRMDDYMLHPVLWVNGELQELPDAAMTGQGFYVWDMSEDGTVIVGMNNAEGGGQNPAFIKDGTLTNIVDCDADETYTFNGGIANSIDVKGNIYGYWQDDMGTMQALVYNETDGLVWIEDAGMPIACCSDGTHIFGMASAMYGPACVLVNDEVKAMSDVYNIEGVDAMTTVTDCTADGSVVVGAESAAIEGLGAVNTPTLFIADTETAGIGADDVTSDVSLTLSGSNLYVTGLYDRVEVFALTGVKLAASSVQGAPVSLAGMPAGTYVVKVTTGQSVKTFKVSR